MEKSRRATPEATAAVYRELDKALDLIKIPEDVEAYVEKYPTPPWMEKGLTCIKTQMICVLNVHGRVAAANWLCQRLRGGPTILLPEGGPIELYRRYLEGELPEEVRDKVRYLLGVGDKKEAEKILDEYGVGAESTKYLTPMSNKEITCYLT